MSYIQSGATCRYSRRHESISIFTSRSAKVAPTQHDPFIMPIIYPITCCRICSIHTTWALNRLLLIKDQFYRNKNGRSSIILQTDHNVSNKRCELQMNRWFDPDHSLNSVLCSSIVSLINHII